MNVLISEIKTVLKKYPSQFFSCSVKPCDGNRYLIQT